MKYDKNIINKISLFLLIVLISTSIGFSFEWGDLLESDGLQNTITDMGWLGILIYVILVYALGELISGLVGRGRIGRPVGYLISFLGITGLMVLMLAYNVFPTYITILVLEALLIAAVAASTVYAFKEGKSGVVKFAIIVGAFYVLLSFHAGINNLMVDENSSTPLKQAQELKIIDDTKTVDEVKGTLLYQITSYKIPGALSNPWVIAIILAIIGIMFRESDPSSLGRTEGKSITGRGWNKVHDAKDAVFGNNTNTGPGPSQLTPENAATKQQSTTQVIRRIDEIIAAKTVVQDSFDDIQSIYSLLVQPQFYTNSSYTRILYQIHHRLNQIGANSALSDKDLKFIEKKTNKLKGIIP